MRLMCTFLIQCSNSTQVNANKRFYYSELFYRFRFVRFARKPIVLYKGCAKLPESIGILYLQINLKFLLKQQYQV